MRQPLILTRSSNSQNAGAMKRKRRTRWVPTVERLEERTVLNAGMLDAAFGVGGQAQSPVGMLPDGATPLQFLAQVLQQADGKVVVAYNDPTSTGPNDSVLTRFNADGSLDVGFGTQGKLRLVDISYVSLANGPNGTIVEAGRVQVGNNAATTRVQRLLANGTVDPTFGNSGQTDVSLQGIRNSLFAQSDGKLVLAGDATFGPVVARLKADGSFDTSFGQGGIASLPKSPLEIAPAGLGHQLDGRIVVAIAGVNGNLFLQRLNSDGSVDASFGTAGVALQTNLNIATFTLYPDGRILVAGEPGIPVPQPQFQLYRFTMNGHLDSTFGNGGFVTSTFAESAEPNTVAVQADGRLVVGGFVQVSGQPTMVFTRYDPDGGLDRTFGNSGQSTVADAATANGVVFDAANRIVAAGATKQDASGNMSLELVRLTADDPLPSIAERNVKQLYLDLLLRAPDAGGLTFWTSRLDQGWSRASVALNFEYSTEGLATTVQSLYSQYLGRSVDPVGLAVWSQFLTAGGTFEQTATFLVSSPEYRNGAGMKTNTGFLTALYGDALNRAIDAPSHAFWEQLLDTSVSAGAVAAAIFASAEYQADVVRATYGRYLRRAPDALGLTVFAKGLASGGRDEQLIATIVGSDEYSERLPG